MITREGWESENLVPFMASILNTFMACSHENPSYMLFLGWVGNSCQIFRLMRKYHLGMNGQSQFLLNSSPLTQLSLSSSI